MGSGEISGIELVDAGRVYFDAQRSDEGLELTPTMDIGSRTIALGEDVVAGSVGRHGVWALAEDGHTVQIAPVEHTLEPETRFLVRRPSTITVPAGEQQQFFSGLYQRLGRRVSFVSRDGSVSLPQITPRRWLLLRRINRTMWWSSIRRSITVPQDSMITPAICRLRGSCVPRR
ncbi:hypothetical protein [Pseudoglutamicibacter albus]|uniref:hypothetical protein n=1 Tax=Pseudoglutamicibacter albus TaxID=98671 RepID=UPI00360F8B90